MKLLLLKRLSLALLLISLLQMPSSAGEVTRVVLKFGTLAPKGTTATHAVDMTDEIYEFLGQRIGTRVKIVGYYGGVMGDDPQMIQKAQAGQLDMLAITLMGMTTALKDIDVFNMAYLIENYGQFDYIMRKNAVSINNLFYQKRWVSYSLIITEGAHDLYMPKPYRTVAEIKENLKASNYTGGPDDTFFKPMGISQTQVGPTEFYPAVRAGVCNAGIIPAAFVIGMQIYVVLPYIIKPSIRIPTSSIILAKRKWDSLPWNFRIYLAAMQPMFYFFTAGLMRDAATAYENALFAHGSKEVKLTPEEIKAWKKPVLDYRKVYLGGNSEKTELYNMIVKSLEEYEAGDHIEKGIYENDPTCKNFPDRIAKVAEALNVYIKTGSKAELAGLEKQKIFEKWRIHDWIAACENYIKTSNPAELKKWMNTFYVTEIVDEIFKNHMENIKFLFGTKEALNDRVEEFRRFYALGGKTYKGYQKTLK